MQDYIRALEEAINKYEMLPEIYREYGFNEKLENLGVSILESSKGITLQSVVSKEEMKSKPLESSKKLLSHMKKSYSVDRSMKKKKIFISHSSKDTEIVDALVLLLEEIGFTKETLFCSSIQPYGVPIGKDIYEYLKSQFAMYDIHLIYVLSKNYYASVACLNEMGAAWVLSCSQTAFLATDFDFSGIQGAINPNNIGIKFQKNYTDKEMYNLRSRMDEFRDNMAMLLDNKKIIERWEEKR